MICTQSLPGNSIAVAAFVDVVDVGVEFVDAGASSVASVCSVAVAAVVVVVFAAVVVVVGLPKQLIDI